MNVESQAAARFSPPSTRHKNLALLSALAEAPDLEAAAAFLLDDIIASTGARRAVLLRFDSDDDSLVPVAHAGFAEARPVELTIAERSHPWMIAALTLSPVRSNGTAGSAREPFDTWTALPMTRPHYRGAPSIWTDAYAAELLAQLGATLVPLEDRHYSSAPFGVVVVDGRVTDRLIQELASLVMFAGPVLHRVAAHREAEYAFDRATQERNRFQQMVNSLPDPVIITDGANNIVVQNRRADDLLLVSLAQSTGRRRAVELNNLLFSSFLSRAAIAGGPSGESRELNLVDPAEGHDLLFEVLSHPLGEGPGNGEAILSVLRDVTDLRRAARELERQVQRVRQAEIKATEERDRLNLILENVADPILVTDSVANIILMNDEAEQLFHGPRSAPHSYRVSQSVRENDTKFASFIADFALADDRTRRERMSLTHPASGAALPVEVVSGKIRNERGEPLAIVSVLHDLTQQTDNERLYEALKRLNGELEGRITAATADLAQQNQRLLWQSEELGKASKLKSDFLASMSHELRTPLNAVIGYAALLIDGIPSPLTEGQLKYVVRSRAAAQHLLSLINDILDLAKIEAGKMPLHIESVSIAEVILEVSQQIKPMMRSKHLVFTSDVSADCPAIETDRTRIKQILLNLLSNAAKFTNTGEVRVTARCDGPWVRIDVHDTGVGIKPEEIDAIWEDFRQLDQSRTRSFGGTGLGLSITRRLTEQLSGQVAVDSEFGQGTTFTVRLPHSIRPQPGQ